VLINTSFNEQEPIVARPEEAIACFRRTEMDVLVLGNCYVTRHERQHGTADTGDAGAEVHELKPRGQRTDPRGQDTAIPRPQDADERGT
jgi:Carbamoyltransferase C-terminus